MSRCFPFPPPGYERKHRAEDLLELKEKTQYCRSLQKCPGLDHLRRGKAQRKKDRKDKRRKDRDKKNEVGNREKRGDKKDRKEKHREKKEKNRHKKDEDGEKKEEKTSVLQDLTVSRRPGEGKAKELHLEGHGYDGSSYAGVNKYPSLSHCHNGAKPFGHGSSQTTLEAKFVGELNKRSEEDGEIQTTLEARLVEELNKRIEEDGEISEDQFCGRDAIRRKVGQEERAGSAVFRNHSIEVVGEKGGSRHEGTEFRIMDLQLPRDELTRKPMAQNHLKLSGAKVEKTPRANESQNHRSFVDKHTSNRADSGKHRDELGDGFMKIHGKDKDNRTDRKMEENSLIKSRKNELETSRNAGITYFSDATAISHKDGVFSQGVKDSAQSEGNVRKRKDINSNGFLHDNEVRPHKIQVQTLHHFSENGRKPVASEVFSKTSSDYVAIPDNIQHDSNLSTKAKVQQLNVSHSKHKASIDDIGNLQMSVDPKGPCHDSGSASQRLDVPMVEDLLAEASRRPPHSDSKYLSRVLRVPDMPQWSECDDQEWLFSKKDPPIKNTAPESTSAIVETQVWSTVIHIESADVLALPYVIPY